MFTAPKGEESSVQKRSGYRSGQGFTLIELLVTIAVLTILILLAAPSFQGLRERRALQGVANGIISAVALAKEEAIKRDEVVRVQFSNLGSAVCVGASTGAAACDCSTAGSCPVAAFPAEAGELRMVKTKAAPAFNGSGAGFSIDPKTGMMVDPTNTGELELETPSGYAVKVRVNAMARSRMCSSGSKAMPGVKSCT